MSTTHNSVPTASRPAPVTNGSSSKANGDAVHSNHQYHHHPSGASANPPANLAKKGKAKKQADPDDAAKAVAARLAQLESNVADEKDQEAEIEREVKKANREIRNHTVKMSDLQKAEYLTKRYEELYADMKRLERENTKNKKRGDQLQKDKDKHHSELSKATTMKDKLEKLCRELQRDNNRLKSENKTLSDSEKHNQLNFDTRYEEMLWQMQDCQEDKDHPQAQVLNIEVEDLFRQRFKSLIDQYELRELHFHSLMRTKELELQYNMARYDKAKKDAEAEAARARSLNTQVLTFSKTETELRSQLNIYVEKFKQVEDTLNNSNDLFLTFRKEMEEMSKKTKRLEKENLQLNRRHEALNRNVLEMAQEREKNNEEVESFKHKNQKLTDIINQMQKQGRGLPSGSKGSIGGAAGSRGGDAGRGQGQGEGEGDHDLETESDYEYEDEDEDELGSEEYDDDTEEEVQGQGGLNSQPQPFGPVPPPPPPTSMPTPNGYKHAA